MDRGRKLNAAVAAVLRGERAALGLTIEELSRRSGIPAVSLQRFLAARRTINFDVLEDLAPAVRMQPADIVILAQERISRGDPELVARMRAGIARAALPLGPDPEGSVTVSS